MARVVAILKSFRGNGFGITGLGVATYGAWSLNTTAGVFTLAASLLIVDAVTGRSGTK